MTEASIPSWLMEKILDRFKYTLECRFGSRGHQLKGAEEVRDLEDLDFSRLSLESYQLVCAFGRNDLLCAGHDAVPSSEAQCPFGISKSRLNSAFRRD